MLSWKIADVSVFLSPIIGLKMFPVKSPVCIDYKEFTGQMREGEKRRAGSLPPPFFFLVFLGFGQLGPLATTKRKKNTTKPGRQAGS